MSEAQQTLRCRLVRRGPLAVAQTIIIVTVDQARPSATSGFECHTASIAAATSAPATFRFKDAHLYHYYNHGPRYIIHNGLCNLSVFILPYGSALILSSLSSGSQWFCLTGIVSTVVTSVIASHINNSDAYNVLMQFVYWLTEWGMLRLFQSTFSYTSPYDTIDILWLLKVSTSRSCFRISPPGSG